MTNETIIKTFLEILNAEDFKLARYQNGVWGLIDLQGAYLDDIDAESFNTITEIMERLDPYHYSYFVDELQKIFDITDYADYGDLITKCKQQKELYAEHKWEFEAVGFTINCTDYEICNTPLEKIKNLLEFTQYDENFIEKGNNKNGKMYKFKRFYK